MVDFRRVITALAVLFLFVGLARAQARISTSEGQQRLDRCAWRCAARLTPSPISWCPSGARHDFQLKQSATAERHRL
jgi:hypothetical protein